MGKINIFLLIIILIVIALIVVALIVKPVKTSNNTPLKDVEITEEIYGFSATIKKINGNTLTLESSIPSADLTQEAIKVTLKTTINNDTKITKLKFPAEIKDEIIPEEIVINIKDLKVGDNVTVSSATNIYSEIKNGEEFFLTDIFVTER